MFYGLQNTTKTKTTAKPSDPNTIVSEPTPEGLDSLFPAVFQDGITTLKPDQWSLSVEGLVETPSQLRFNDLATFTSHLVERRIVSSEGWSFRGQWKGVLLSDVLNKATILDEAAYLIQGDTNGKQICLPLKALLKHEPMLATKVNNHFLTPLYGGPVRLVCFDRYIQFGLGPITQLTLSKEPLPAKDNLFQAKGFDADGLIQPGDYYAFDHKAFRSFREPTPWVPSA